MSVLIPQLSEGFIGSSGASSSVLCENYSQLSYFVVYSQTGTFIIQGSVDGGTWYPLTTVTIASSGTPYFDKINITTKFIRFSYTLGVAGTVISQAFFFDNGSINITNTVGGGVSSVTASGPLASSGGSTPNITISKADATTDGYLSMSDFNTFNSKISGVNTISPILNDGLNPITLTLASSGVSAGTYNYPTLAVNSNGLITSCSSNTPVTSATAGTGISLSAGTGNITITNSLPDQTVVLTNGTGINTTGTYPNFTITNTGVTSVSGTAPIVSSGGTTPAISLANSGVSAATYTNATVTVNAQGLITAASSGSSGNKSFFTTAFQQLNSAEGTFYFPISYVEKPSNDETLSANLTNSYIVVPMAGTFQTAFVSHSAAWSVRTRVYALFVNGAATSLTMTIGPSQTTASNTADSVSVSAGDLVCWRIVHTGGSTTAMTLRISVGFTAS